MTILITGCSGGKTDTNKKILRTNNSSEPGSLDPALAQGTHESWILDHVFEGLFKKSEDGTVVPGMAESYTLADDQVTYTFKLRDDIKWSNGELVTAYDFEFAWKRALDPALAVVESNPDWAKDPSTYVSNGPFKLTEWMHDVSVYYYNLNTTIEPFNNVNIRKALSMAINRQTIVDKITQGGQLPAEGVVPFGMLDENGNEHRDGVGNLIEYNVEKAKELFQKGLEETGFKAEDFSQFSILYNTSEGHKKIAEAIQEMWRQNLGIEVQLENVDFQVKLDREKAGDYQISRAGWVGDYMDPITFIELWESSSSFNDAKFKNNYTSTLNHTLKNHM